jgi:hypothetical protein
MKKLALAAALMAAGIAQAATTEFIIFKDANFRGESDTIKGEVAQLTGGFSRSASSLVVRGGHWEVCTRDHFRGDCYVIPPGEYGRLSPDLANRIVSVRFLGVRAPRDRQVWAYNEYRDGDRRDRRDGRWGDRDRRDRHARGSIDLYSQPGFRGQSLRVDDNEASLRSERFDGRASSVVVNDGVWQLCTEPRFEGVCATLEPGRYPRLAQLNDRVSSIRQIR